MHGLHSGRSAELSIPCHLACTASASDARTATLQGALDSFYSTVEQDTTDTTTQLNDFYALLNATLELQTGEAPEFQLSTYAAPDATACSSTLHV
jgi:hypothetical protein